MHLSWPIGSGALNPVNTTAEKSAVRSLRSGDGLMMLTLHPNHNFLSNSFIIKILLLFSRSNEQSEIMCHKKCIEKCKKKINGYIHCMSLQELTTAHLDRLY